jgi:hypothetical protein
MPRGEQFRLYYPGLNDVATAIWRRWLAYYEDAFDGYEYNVRVGEGFGTRNIGDPELKKLWQQLTQKRIDVVAMRSGEPWVIEIEERPGARTYGQVKLYQRLLQRDRGLRDLPRGAVVSARLGFDMGRALQADGILYFVVRPVGEPSFPPSFPPPGSPAPLSVGPVEPVAE